jgi:hypothetical protein
LSEYCNILKSHVWLGILAIPIIPALGRLWQELLHSKTLFEKLQKKKEWMNERENYFCKISSIFVNTLNIE